MIGILIIAIGIASLSVWLFAWAFIVKPQLAKSGRAARTGANIPLTILNDYFHFKEMRRNRKESVRHLNILISLGFLPLLLIPLGFVLMMRSTYGN